MECIEQNSKSSWTEGIMIPCFHYKQSLAVVQNSGWALVGDGKE